MKKLRRILKKHSGRRRGKITVRHRGGRNKRFLRKIDFKRNKADVWGVVEAIEYDPNRSARIALVLYEDGERRYIISPEGLKVGSRVIASENAPLEVGNTLPLGAIPVGTQIHNLEIRAGKGGQIVKSAGSAATVFGREGQTDGRGGGWVLVKLPSGEVKRFAPEARATIGQVGNIEARNQKLRKAGAKRHLGIRPAVRGVAMHPKAHPHGGGEGRSPVGLKYQKTVYGKKAVGKTRKRRKYSDKMIVEKRSGR